MSRDDHSVHCWGHIHYSGRHMAPLGKCGSWNLTWDIVSAEFWWNLTFNCPDLSNGRSRGGARAPSIFWVKKEKMTEGRKANWASKLEPGPLPSSKSGPTTAEEVKTTKCHSIVCAQFEQKGTAKLSEDMRSAYLHHIPLWWRFCYLDSKWLQKRKTQAIVCVSNIP